MSGTILLILRIFASGILYLFLVLALWVLWQDLRKQSHALSSLHIPTLTLVMNNGHEERVSYSVQEVVIGRDPLCEYPVDDKTISARHSRLTYHHTQWWVEDMNSKNGTFLNQIPIKEAVVVTNGDQLRCGQVMFDVLIGEEND